MTVAPVTLSSNRLRPAGVNESPEWVRISMASAIALRFRSGRFTREFEFGGMNLLLNYEDGCRSDCGYCGLARTRPGTYEDKSFIRVEWPLVSTDELVDRMAARDDTMTRLCISMVTHPHAYRDTLDIAARITARVTAPLSILVAPPTLNRTKLERFKDVGVEGELVGAEAVRLDQVLRQLDPPPPAQRRLRVVGHPGIGLRVEAEQVGEDLPFPQPGEDADEVAVGLAEADQRVAVHLPRPEDLPGVVHDLPVLGP